MTRLTSEFFVSSLVRRIFSEGGFAAVSKKGALEAGAIFVSVDRLDNSYDLYGPAPQAMFVELKQGRLFEKILERVGNDQVQERLRSEARMDPDYWLVEIEARDGSVDLPVAEEEDGGRTASDLFRF